MHQLKSIETAGHACCSFSLSSKPVKNCFVGLMLDIFIDYSILYSADFSSSWEQIVPSSGNDYNTALKLNLFEDLSTVQAFQSTLRNNNHLHSSKRYYYTLNCFVQFLSNPSKAWRMSWLTWGYNDEVIKTALGQPSA